MKKQSIKILCGLVSVLLLFTTSCTKDYTSASSVPLGVAFGSPQAMAEIAVGLQRTYTLGRGSSLYNRVTINGLLTSELVVLNQGNTGEYQLQLGAGNVDGTNTLGAGLWTTSNKIIFDADNLRNGASSLGDKAYASGIIAYADFFKALALGDLSMFWEKVPTSTGKNVSFADRSQGFTMAIAAIDEALAAVTANPISPTFMSNIPPGFDIVSSLHALRARYLIFTGKYPEALAEASIPSQTVKSVFNFQPATPNPVWETATSTNNVTAVSSVTTLGLPTGLQPDPSDQRLPFYTTTTYASKIKGFADKSTTPWPVYLPGEMTLIRAEAYARQNDLVDGLAELNKVVTKQPANDAYGVGAGLPPVVGLTQAQLLDEIYKQRCIELFMSGFKLEDMRRFGRPNSEKKRNFLPYPFLERDNNSNTPPDPAF
jgi:starch-binding outer membrane protein, SusD/RagB family